MINKLTGEPVSEEMQNVLKRLAVNEAVPESEIYALKEIKEANSCISSSKPTIELRNRTGIQLGVYNRLQNMGSAVTKSDGAVSFSGEIRREKRLDIVIGLPASGKSSALVEPISELYESRVIDSDEAKKLLPEFNNGWGAGVVHKESQLISDRQLSAALKAGENITYPRVGGDSSELVVIARLFELTVYTMIAPVPLSTFACDGLSDIGKGFLKSYAAVTLQSIVLAIMFIAYAAVNNALIAGRIGSYNLALDGIMGLITTLTLGIGVMSSGAWAKRIVGSS